MTQSIDDLMKNWASIFESAGITGSKADWMSKYVHQQSTISNIDNPLSTTTQSIDENTSNNFPSILPMGIMSAASKYFSKDMVSVQPINPPVGISQEEMDRIKSEIKTENRESKIDSILEGKEFKEKDVKEHPDYKESKPLLLYLDYSYGGTTSSDFNKDNETIDKLK